MPDKTPKPNLKKPTAVSGSEDESQKIGLGSIYLMIGLSLFADILIIFINFIFDLMLIGWLTAPVLKFLVIGFFMFWFMTKGVKIITPKRIRLLGIGVVISIIPYIPPVTFYVARMIASTKNKNMLGPVNPVSSPK